MKLVNLTPHPICYRIDEKDVVFEPSGTVARVDMVPGLERVVDVQGVPVTISGPPRVGTTIHLPEPQPDTMYIVSLVVRQARPDRKDLVSPGTGPQDGAVRNENGQIVAVTRFIGNE